MAAADLLVLPEGAIVEVYVCVVVNSRGRQAGRLPRGGGCWGAPLSVLSRGYRKWLLYCPRVVYITLLR